MEKSLKLRISRMFKSSFDSCKSRNISDAIENPVFIPHKQQKLKQAASDEPLSSSSHIIKPHARPLPSVCRPRCYDSSEPSKNSLIKRSSKTLPRQKVHERYSLFYSKDYQNYFSCPPSSPIMTSLCSSQGKKSNKKSNKKSKSKSYSRKNKEAAFVNPNSNDYYYYGGNWFSSEDESDTFFSSRSLSSDSSESWRGHSFRGSSRRRRDSEITGLLPEKGGKVKVNDDSFAVVKCSSDPYNDFRTSMVEMIIEKQIFGAKDLENLLQCFLSLNSSHHHRIIVEVFMEIWEALFSNWS